MFYCLIVGSRDFNDYELLKEKCDKLLSNQSEITIVSGGAKGADSLAERYAHDKGYELKVFKADWDSYGKSAGYIRNEQMHKYISQFDKRGVIAFWNGTSKGTAHNFELGKRYGSYVKIVRV